MKRRFNYSTTGIFITAFYGWLALPQDFCVTSEEMSHQSVKKNVLKAPRLLSEKSWKKMFLTILFLCSG